MLSLLLLLLNPITVFFFVRFSSKDCGTWEGGILACKVTPPEFQTGVLRAVFLHVGALYLLPL